MQYSKRTLIALLPCLLLISTNAHTANTYQAEFTGGFRKIDKNVSTETTALAANFYLSPVNTEDKPLAAAAFLDKSSSISVGYTRQDVDATEIDTSLIGVNYITKKGSYIFSTGYRAADFSVNNNQASADFEVKALGFGKYLDQWSSLKFDYLNSEAKNIVTNSNISFIDSKVYALSYITIRPISSNQFYGIGLNTVLQKNSDDTKNRAVGISGAYYVDRSTSFAANASFNSGDVTSREGNIFRIGAEHFFTPQINLGVELSKFIAKDSMTEDSDSYSIIISSRF